MSHLNHKRIDALLHPTQEKAMEFWDYNLLGPPIKDAPLAGLHKARLMWPGSTDEMRKESTEWLLSRGYKLEKMRSQ